MEDEWRVVWPDGSVHWLAGRWRVVKNAEGKPVRMMGVNIDVTARKHMEEELRKSEERFRLSSTRAFKRRQSAPLSTTS
jgi:PAS domain-containing protein